jgi:hypothetical protein
MLNEYQCRAKGARWTFFKKSNARSSPQRMEKQLIYHWLCAGLRTLQPIVSKCELCYLY